MEAVGDASDDIDSPTESKHVHFKKGKRKTRKHFKLKVAAKGNLEKFQRMYNADNSRLNNQDSKGSTAAHKAAGNGRINILEFIVKHNGDLNVKDKGGNTPLHLGVLANQPDVIIYLLDNKADSTVRNDLGLAPLHLAVEENAIESLKALLNHGTVDPNLTGEKGMTALHYCADKDRAECAKILLENGALPCIKCQNGFFPINVAGKCAAAKTLEILIQHGEKLGYKREDILTFSDKEKNMPLHCAVNSGDITAVRVCLKAGAPVDAKREDKSTPVHFACAQGSVDMVKLMHEMQPDRFENAMMSKDILLMTPLHRAALFDHVAVVEYLINLNVDVNVRDINLRTPLLLASSEGGWRTVNVLMQNGADITVRDKDNRNFLHLLIKHGGGIDKFGDAIIFKGVQDLINKRDEHGCTPLHYASKGGRLNAIDDLLRLGAVINAKDNEKKSPLHFAAEYGRYNTCKRLLESVMGPNIMNETDGDGLTALHIAAANGQTKIITLLMQKGAYVTRDDIDNSPLHLAAANGYTKSMKLLLQVYPNLLDQRNKMGDTALHVASREGHASAVELLLCSGATVTKNSENLSFFDIAIQEKHSEVGYAIVRHERCIITALKNEKKVAVTSSTGMASAQLGFGATTIHHWSGIGDGRYSAADLINVFLTDNKYHDAKKRIADADVLIIDEIGMLSEAVFEKIELVCRLGRNSSCLFGGLQVIASGDFKQLPPVPNDRYGDPGFRCFRSRFFKETFVHHFNLLDVVRQHEPELIRAVNQLCDGRPDERTEALLKSLNREFEDSVDGDICRLYGTNFDAMYVNQLYLDALDGEIFQYKAIDEGKNRILRKTGADKVLNLKVGAPVILTRNMPGQLYNGQRGKIHALDRHTGPVVNFDGKLVTLGRVSFEQYDPVSKKVLATRLQYPLKLAYAITVHRAQGQTLSKVEVDCFSFFEAGQMGVAVGRAVSLSGLRIVNYNPAAARLKHPQEVYDFYTFRSLELKEDLSCCENSYTEEAVANSESTQGHESEDENCQERFIHRPTSSAETICPWPINDFTDTENGKSFLPDRLSDSSRAKLQEYAAVLYDEVKNILRKRTKSNDDFVRVMKEVNNYLTSEQHVTISKQELSEYPKPQKLSAKLFMWILECEIKVRSGRLVQSQTERFENKEQNIEQISDVAKSKLRYLAGACIHKIISRLRVNVLKTIENPRRQTQTEREWDFRRCQLLRSLRLTEEEAMAITDDPNSMHEIQYKQGPTRGLMHVSDAVFQYFVELNTVLRKLLSSDAFHLYSDNIYTLTRSKLFSDDGLLEKWIQLFNNSDDEVFISLLTELYELVIEYFLRVAMVDSLHTFKSEIPRKKKQALRSKITALTERQVVTNKQSGKEMVPSDGLVICPCCACVLEEEPNSKEDESIACDDCNSWYHFRCQGLNGHEPFLQNSSSKWKCSLCREGGTRKKMKRN